MVRGVSFLLGAGLALGTLVASEDVLISDRLKHSKRFIDAEGNYNMSFYHINDVHAHLDKFNSAGLDCTDLSKPCVGGYARVRTAVSESRPQHPDSVFLNVGDEFQGTMYFSYYGGGSKIAEALNMMGFDAMTLGNHEFDKGDDVLGDFLELLDFPIVSANIRSNHTVLSQKIKPYVIIDKYELAVIGVTTDTTATISSPSPGTTFEDPFVAVQRTVDHIRSTTSIKRIAAITHIGYEEDQRLAKETTGLYLILGGHSHTLLGDMEGAEGKYPTKVQNKEDKEVFIVQAHRWGEYLGYIDVTFDSQGQVLTYHGGPIHMNDSVKADPELQALVDEWRKPFKEYSEAVLGESKVVLDQTACRTGECLLGSVIADAMWDNRAKGKPVESQPAFAFTNSGGVRASIDIGNITRGEVQTAFPFGNEMVELHMTGQQLWDLFEGVLKRENANTSALVTSFVQVSRQVELRWNRTSTENPSIGNLTSFRIDKKPIDLEKTYTVVTIDFLAGGGDNMINPRITNAPALGKLDDALGEYIEKYSPIDVKLEGRLLPNPDTPKCKKRKRGEMKKKRSSTGV